MKANLFGLTLIVILSIQTCQSLETETSEERRAKCKCRVQLALWIFFLYIFFILLFSASYFSSYSFPCEFFLKYHKKIKQVINLFIFFRMMAAQVPIEMALAIQGKFLYKKWWVQQFYVPNIFTLCFFQRRMFLKRWNPRWLLCQWIWRLLCLYAIQV